jgi:putative ABC transport system permease protein
MRTFLAVMAIGLEVTMILLILGLADGMVNESTTRQRGVGADILLRPSTSTSALITGAAGLPESIVEELETIPGVKMAVGTAFSMEAEVQTVTGVDLDKFGQMSGGLRFLEGGPFEEPYDVVVDDIYARQKKLSVGQTVRFHNRDFRLVGVVESGKMSRIFISLRTKQEVMGWEDKLSQVFIKLDRPEQAREFVQQLKERYPENPIWVMEEFIALFTAQTRGRADYFVNAIVGIAVTVGFIVVLISMYTAVLDRTREIGILKSLGASPAYIVEIFIRETVMLTVVGIVLGIGMSYVAQAAFEESFPLIVMSIFRSHIIWTTVLALVGSFLGAFFPSLRAARQDAISALAYE